MDAIKGLILGMIFAATACYMSHAKPCDGAMLPGLSVHSRDRSQYNPLNVGLGCVMRLGENARVLAGAYYNSGYYWSQELIADYTWELLPGHRVGVVAGMVWYKYPGAVLAPTTRHKLSRDWELDTIVVVPGDWQPMEKYRKLPGVVAFYLVKWLR